MRSHGLVIVALVLLCANATFPTQARAQTYLGIDRNDYPGDGNISVAQYICVHRILAQQPAGLES